MGTNGVSPGVGNGEKTVMIVDDDPAIVDAVSMILELEGYHVLTASDGSSITPELMPKPDLLLLDIWMTGIDGATICRSLKKSANTKEIPVIMISANRDTQKIAVDCGADDFISKPFDIEDLLHKVRSYTHP